MKHSKFLLTVAILLMFTMNAFAQGRSTRGGDDSPNEIIREVMDGTRDGGGDDIPDEIIWDVMGGTVGAPELDAADIKANDIQCPDGWIYTDDGGFSCA